MINHVVRFSAKRHSVMVLDDRLVRELRMLTRRVREFFAIEGPQIWPRKEDASFLSDLKAGALVLDSIAHERAERKIVLDDATQLALMTCVVFTMEENVLAGPEKRALREMVLLLSDCCSIVIDPQVLPPFSSLRPSLRRQKLFASHYRSMLEPPANNRLYALTLGDALRLYRILLSHPPCVETLIHELGDATETLRATLHILEEGSP